MTDQSSNSHQMMLEDLPECISLPELRAGTMHLISQDGEIEAYGQALAPASHSVQPESGKAKTTNGTSGRNSFGSLESVALTQSLANRLKERLGMGGSMEYLQTWKEKVTPAGRLYWAHTARAHPTCDSGCTGWPTVRANETNESVESVVARRKRLREAGDTKTGSLMNLSQAAQMVGYATPSTRDYKDVGDLNNSRFRKDGKERNDTVPRQAALVGYPTPNVSDVNASRSDRAQQYSTRWMLRKNHSSQLAHTVQAFAGYPTPTSEPSSGEVNANLERHGNKWRNKVTGRILQTTLTTEMKLGLTGPNLTSSHSSTEKRGALNPALSRWLMGYPVAWCQAAILASRMLKQRAKRV